MDVAAWIWQVPYTQIRYRYCNKLQTLCIKFCTVLPRLSQHLCVSSFVQYYPGYHNTFVYQVLYSPTPVITTPLCIKFCTVLPRLSQHLCASSFVQYYPGYHNTFVYQVLYSTTPVITTPLCIKFCTVLPRLSQHLCASSVVQYYPGYHNTFGQRGFIRCSDKRNGNETFLDIHTINFI